MDAKAIRAGAWFILFLSQMTWQIKPKHWPTKKGLQRR